MKRFLFFTVFSWFTSFVAFGAPFISEFLADNNGLYLDDHGRASDWIEIANPEGETVDLSGWFLTDDSETLQKWAFPAGTRLNGGAYLLVHASGLDQTTGTLHANFSLNNAGEYLALVDSSGTIVDEIAPEGFGLQYENISYGRVDGESGYLRTVTPGAANTEIYGPPPNKIDFSVEGKTFFESEGFEVELTHEDPEVQIRYTTDGSEPSTSLFSSSPIYQGPITVDKTMRLTAKAFKTGAHLATSRMETYIELAEDMRDFSSNLPLCIMDSYGENVDSINRQSQNGTFVRSPTSTVFIDVDPQSGRATPAGEPDFAGSGGMRVRGQSSAGFPKKQYAYNTQHANGDNDNVTILGFPSENDWIIHAPYADKTLMRNYLSYSWSRRMGHYASRVKFMEVFFNWQADQPVSRNDYRGVYVLMEELKRDNDRIDLQDLNPEHESEPEITGGYIVRKDKEPERQTTFRTSREGQTLQILEPGSDLTDAQRQWITGYFNEFEDALHGAGFADPENGYARYLNVANAIDNHLLVEVTKNIDGYRLSNYVAKDRLGKLFFIAWDYNLSLGNADYLDGWKPTGWYYNLISSGDYPWYRRLFEDPGFVLRYADRWYELRRGMFSDEALLAEIDGLESYLSEAAERNFEKWDRLGVYDWPNPPGWQSRDTYAKEVDFMRQWLLDRVEWMDDQFEKPVRFSQPGGVVSPGTELTIMQSLGLFNPRPGTVYYTWDGSDPRLPNNEPNPEAFVYEDPLQLQDSGTVRARLLQTTGEWTALNEASFVVGTPASADNLRVTEIMYNPAPPTAQEKTAGFLNNDDFEFLELLNTSGETVQLFGMEWTKGIVVDSSALELPTLPPGGRGLLVSDREAFEMRYGTGLPVIGSFVSTNLSNSGENLEALDVNGDVIFSFAYNDGATWPQEADGEGYSLVLADERGSGSGVDLSAGESWTRSRTLNGSPGAAESTEEPVDAYALWRREAFSESELADENVSGDLADPDADGLSNAVEFALMTDPRQADSQEILEAALESVEGVQHLTFTFPLNTTLGDIQVAVETSTDLEEWTRETMSLVDESPGPEGTNWQVYQTLQPVDGEARLFVRLSVSRP